MRDRGPVTAPPLAEAHALAVGYAGPPVLEDVSLAIAPGTRLAVLGPNGGGKTTLFRALLGQLRPLRGTLAVRAGVATVAQTERSRLDFPVSAAEVVLMGSLGARPWWRRPGRAERRRALAALAEVDLQSLAGATFGELSGGQRQRVLIARALLQDARLLLLDEPFRGLDAPSADRLHALVDTLASEGRAVLVATHDVAQALRWDAVLCLNRRQVALGPPRATLTADVLAATYGEALVRVPGSADAFALSSAAGHG